MEEQPLRKRIAPETGVQPQDGGNKSRDPMHGRARMQDGKVKDDPMVKALRVWAHLKKED